MGQRATIIIVGLVMLGIGAGAGTLGYIWFVGGSGEASQPISAPTLSLDPTATVPVATQIAQIDSQLDEVLDQLADADVDELTDSIATLGAKFSALSAAVGIAEAAVVEVTSTPVPAAAPEEPTVEPTIESAASESDGMSGRSLFRIDSERTVVRFMIDEELQGQPKTVVGVTDEVAGDIIIDFDNPANSEIGEIRINVRTLETDSEIRDRALRTEILESRLEEYEFASFVPTAITGLPESVGMDDEISFQVTGDFTLRTITQTITFDVTATMVTEERIDGLATTMVTRDMYDLNIPSAPGVANVSNDVFLEIEFTARLVEGN